MPSNKSVLIPEPQSPQLWDDDVEFLGAVGQAGSDNLCL